MKKSEYQHYLHCLVTILISTKLEGAALIGGLRLFQCVHPKGRCLFEDRRLLEEIPQLYRNFYEVY